MAAPENQVAVDGRRRPGRKRDAAMVGRIQEAAVNVFASEGWRGFTLDSVARAAGVGKSTIYLRYATREELMQDIFAERNYQWLEESRNLEGIDAQLRAFAHSYAAWLDTSDGLWSIRLNLETRLNPDFAEVVSGQSTASISEAHGIIQRAKRRGELPATTSAAVLLDSLLGALLHHTLSSTNRQPYSSAEGRRFVDRLVDMLLRGTQAVGVAAGADQA